MKRFSKDIELTNDDVFDDPVIATVWRYKQVMLQLSFGRWQVEAFPTPQQARELAALLIEAADAVEANASKAA